MASVELDSEFMRMQLADLSIVLTNERQAYAHPWTEGTFRDCVKGDYETWLVVFHGRNIGHGILSAAAGEAHLLNVCIAPQYQGHGHGRHLVLFMLQRAKLRGARSIFLEVRLSNLRAYKLYENLGFNEIGIRKDYYPAFGGREDALVLAMELASSHD